MANPLIVKICGIKTRAILETAIEAGADMVGFMHFQRSPRHLDLDPIGELISLARGRAETCVVLVNPDNTLVAQVAALGPDWIQLHGPETPHRVEAIRDEAGVAVMKVVPVGQASDLTCLPDFDLVSDRLMLDTKAPKTSDRPGGNGLAFDWTLLKPLDPAIGFMLSGGLTPSTVGTAIATVRPIGVDVSSGVESAPGVKDPALVAAFVRNARAAAG